jgi:hypothetical protein
MYHIRLFFEILDAYPMTAFLLGAFILALFAIVFAGRFNVEKRSEKTQEDRRWRQE